MKRLSHAPGLRPQKSSVRPVVSRDLDNLDTRDAQEKLIAALRNKSPAVRATAAEALSRAPSDKVRRALVHALSDSSWRVRVQALESLVPALAGKSVPRAVLTLLSDRHELVRVEAAASLGAIGNRRAVPALYRALEDSSPLVRSYAAAAIGVLGRRGDRRRLEHKLETEQSDEAKVGFYDALYTLGEGGALGRMVDLLRSDDFEVRSAAAATLANRMATRRNWSEIRAQLIDALRRERTVNAKARIEGHLKSMSQRFRRNAQ